MEASVPAGPPGSPAEIAQLIHVEALRRAVEYGDLSGITPADLPGCEKGGKIWDELWQRGLRQIPLEGDDLRQLARALDLPDGNLGSQQEYVWGSPQWKELCERVLRELKKRGDLQ